MQNLPLVTVICISYNHEAYVIEALNSVMNQTYSNIELVIADDFSTDNSRTVIENWVKNNPQICFLPNEKNIGNTKTFNEALKKSKGTFILDLAADDILEKNCIETLLSPFTKNGAIGISYANTLLVSESNEPIATTYASKEYPNNKNIPESGDIYKQIIGQKFELNSVASLVKREVFEKLNAYDESLYYEDLDLWIRASRTYHFAYTDKVVVRKRVLENSLGNHFYKPFNKKAKKLNHSTYQIINKAVHLNKTLAEDKSLLKRVHYEMDKCLKTCNLFLFLKYIKIELALRFSHKS